MLRAAVEKRWLELWVATYGEVVQTWPGERAYITENAAAIVAALLVVADQLENVSLSVAEK